MHSVGCCPLPARLESVFVTRHAQMYYMQGSVAGSAGRGPKSAAAAANAAAAAASPADGSALSRNGSPPPSALKPEAKPFVPPQYSRREAADAEAGGCSGGLSEVDCNVNKLTIGSYFGIVVLGVMLHRRRRRRRRLLAVFRGEPGCKMQALARLSIIAVIGLATRPLAPPARFLPPDERAAQR